MSRRRNLPASKPSDTSAPAAWRRRGAFILAAVALFSFVFFAYAGGMWASALYRLLVEAPLLLLWLIAMAGVGRWAYRLFRLPDDDPAALPASLALGIGLYALLTLGLGLAGVLGRAMAIVMLLTGFALAAIDLLTAPARKPQTANGNSPRLAAWLVEPIPGATWLWLLAVPFLAIATLGALMPPGVLWDGEPHWYDVVEYHLQVPREWFEAGRILPLRHNVFSYFPFNVEMHYLLAMHLRGGPWAGMYLAQLMHLAMIVIAVAAVAGLVGRRGRFAAVFAACTPWLTLLAPIAYNEGGLLLFGTLAIGYAWRALAPPGPHSAGSLASRVQVGAGQEEQRTMEPASRARLLALAGTFTGFACGVKLTAVPMLLLPIPLVFAAICLLRREGAMVRPAIAFVVCALLVFSPWLIRNLAWTRNPVFPEAMSVLGRAHFSTEQAERWRLAYVPPMAQRSLEGRLRAAWEQIFADWRYGFVLIPAAAAVLLRRRRWGGDGVFLAALLLIWLLFWLLFTHLQSRFYVLAIPALSMIVSRVEAPVARLAVICAVLLQGGFGLLNLQAPVLSRLHRFIIVVGAESITAFQREDVAEAIKGNGDVCLVGDAIAFLYDVPMSRLHYRTVFDVDVRGRNVVEAWSDGCPRREGDVLIINYEELRRFANTYYGIPDPGGGRSGTVVLRAGDPSRAGETPGIIPSRNLPRAGASNR